MSLDMFPQSAIDYIIRRSEMYKRPSVFRLFDFLTFGGVALLATAIAVYISTTKQTFEAYAITWLTTACFWGVYFAYVIARAKYLARFSYMTSHGILIDPGDMTWGVQAFEEEIERIVMKYEDPKLQLEKHAGNLLAPMGAFAFDDYVFIRMTGGPLPNQHSYGAKVAGFVRVGGNIAHVVYNDVNQELRTTALGHELGHIILGRCWNWKSWSPGQHHKFMADNGLG